LQGFGKGHVNGSSVFVKYLTGLTAQGVVGKSTVRKVKPRSPPVVQMNRPWIT
jgi:hypothetical protein